MIRISALLIAFCFIIHSCNNPETAENNAADNTAGIAKLNDALKKYEAPSQIIKVSAGKPCVVTGRKGTKISINPDDLITESGKPLGQTIEVELKELTSQRQLVSSNAQTVCDGKLLVSGGAYFIGITSNGEKLKLKDGKTLRVQFPELSAQEMGLFYGQRDELGQMNWQKTTETFKASQQQKPAAVDTVKVRKKSKSDVDAIMDYVDSGDTTTTQEDRETMVKREKDYKVSQKVYDEIGIAKLGWINCDKFLEAVNKTDLYVTFNPQDSVKYANVYVVFKDINSVIHDYYYPGNSPKFKDMPVGYKAKLIAYTVKNEKVFAYSADLTIAKAQKLTVNLKEVNDKDFKKLIDN